MTRSSTAPWWFDSSIDLRALVTLTWHPARSCFATETGEWYSSTGRQGRGNNVAERHGSIVQQQSLHQQHKINTRIRKRPRGQANMHTTTVEHSFLASVHAEII